MTARDDTEIEGFSILSKLVTVLLFLLAQVVAALLIGSVALAVSPTRAAEANPAAFVKEWQQARAIHEQARPSR